MPEPPPLVWWELADMEFCLVPAGEFLMGSAGIAHDATLDERPMHWVYLNACYIGRYPVTQAQYCRFSGHLPWVGKQNHPQVLVTWHDAVIYSLQLGMRLPTEAEWEKAARGTDCRIYPWGDVWNAGLCNSREEAIGDTVAVGTYSPAGDSPYGCADMVGSVYQWVADWYDPFYYGDSPVANPPGPGTEPRHRCLAAGEASIVGRAAIGPDRPWATSSTVSGVCSRHEGVFPSCPAMAMIHPPSYHRLNRSHLKQCDRGVAAPRANVLLPPVQDSVAMIIRGQVNL